MSKHFNPMDSRVSDLKLDIRSSAFGFMNDSLKLQIWIRMHFKYKLNSNRKCQYLERLHLQPLNSPTLLHVHFLPFGLVW